MSVTTRWEVEQAVLRSKLPPQSRLIVLMLLVKADNETAVIPPEFSPSLTTLEAATGLSRSMVAKYLSELESLGWVKRSQPARKTKYDRTNYALAPGADPEWKPPRPNRNRKADPANEAPDQAAEAGSGEASSSPPQEPLSSPSQGLVPPKDHSGDASSPSQGPPVVLPKDHCAGGSSPSQGHASSKELPAKNSSKRPARKRAAPAAEDGSEGETENQRINRLARVYCDRVKLSNFNAVAGVVKKAVHAGVTDERITHGLNKLADDGRAVTVDSLRYAIYGVPPSQFAQRRGTPGAGSNYQQQNFPPEAYGEGTPLQ